MNSRPHIILFHHAGGNAASLNMFALHFKQEFNVTMMEMPGRGRRRLEALKETSEQIINDFAKSIPAEGRLILVGHSLGAYMAYLMAGYFRKEMPEREFSLV
ncbi:Thioesterase domain protein [Vibrio ruber DSM 16370]|uniref:Thioesterase domain protein n=1 Tax=Vibrio ruber (strain DSM 16370 / JCM 11486 / BCRC 17186 / CECT 7878 / LMG 23124 / VR1) TaxID=1123498 RepID=A0A1R4LN67_VIBR1|nr:thioesterase domain-containing protein [Vibrio ruber]SJN57849.1 Thioesterase domain protein [Vibrio ruber DSM 16370]